jgi:hypothetical protein
MKMRAFIISNQLSASLPFLLGRGGAEGGGEEEQAIHARGRRGEGGEKRRTHSRGVVMTTREERRGRGGREMKR